MTALTQAALAPATQRAYERTWRNLRTFLQLVPGADLFPISTANVIEFVAACFEDGCGASALASHCSAITYGHRIRGLPDPANAFLAFAPVGGGGAYVTTLSRFLRITQTLTTVYWLCVCRVIARMAVI